jgi:hypothetical protein
MAHGLEQDIAIDGPVGLSGDLLFARACDRTQERYRLGIYPGYISRSGKGNQRISLNEKGVEMMENRRQVLDMLAQGKITADEAERLLSLVDRPAGAEAGGSADRGGGKTDPKYLRVVIQEGAGPGSEQVNIRVPMGLIRAGVRLASLLPSNATSKINEKLKEKGVPIDLEKIKAGDLEDLVDSLSDFQVNSQDGNDKVRIYVE